MQPLVPHLLGSEITDCLEGRSQKEETPTQDYKKGGLRVHNYLKVVTKWGAPVLGRTTTPQCHTATFIPEKVGRNTTYVSWPCRPCTKVA